MEPSIETEERLRREAEEARRRAAELQALEAAAEAQLAAAAQAALDEAAARERIRQVGGPERTTLLHPPQQPRVRKLGRALPLLPTARWLCLLHRLLRRT